MWTFVLKIQIKILNLRRTKKAISKFVKFVQLVAQFSTNHNNQLMKFIKIITFSLFTTSLFAQYQTQPNPVAASSGADRLKALDKRKTLTNNSLLNAVSYRNVGPTVQSGRVVDVDVNPKDPSVFYVCYASGGLWKTESNGSEMTPIFDNQAVMTIGDVAVNWDKKII
jgi:hypothetical protein